jgi:hypothetical protein
MNVSNTEVAHNEHHTSLRGRACSITSVPFTLPSFRYRSGSKLYPRRVLSLAFGGIFYRHFRAAIGFAEGEKIRGIEKCLTHAAQFVVKRDGRDCDDRAVCYDADFLAGHKAERSQPFPV